MIFKNNKRIIKHHYTIVELLVVLVIAGLLTGMTVTGIKGALARQGATGAVRTLAGKVSLAQSFAVSKNRYVALLVPDFDGVNTNSFTGSPVSENTAKDTSELWTNKYSSCFVKNRLCYVEKKIDSEDEDGDGRTDDYIYNFERWVDGYEWQTLPKKTVAFITKDGGGDTSVPIQVINIPDPTHPNPNIDPDDSNNNLVKSTALIFKPSGALVNTSIEGVVIRIFRAAYIPYQEPGVTENAFYWQGTENENKGWKIVINGFTGRSRFCLGGETID